MVRLDTVKLSVPYPALKGFDPKMFINEQKCDISTGEIEETFILKKQQVFGLDHFAIKKTKSEVILQFSAKALKNNYFELINRNTIQHIFETINKSGIATFNVIGAIENSTILKCDITNNLKVKDTIPNYLSDFQIMSLNLKYRVVNYPTGLELMPLVESNKKRYLIYDKFSEISRKTAINRELSRHIDLKSFQQILRTEGNLKSFEDIRYFFEIPKGIDPLLSTVLMSRENVSLKYFDHIFPIDPTKVILPSPLVSFSNLDETEKTFGKRAIIKACNYDEKAIRTFIKTKVKGNISSYIKNYRSLKSQMLLEELNNDFTRVIEVRELLKAEG